MRQLSAALNFQKTKTEHLDPTGAYGGTTLKTFGNSGLSPRHTCTSSCSAKKIRQLWSHKSKPTTLVQAIATRGKSVPCPKQLRSQDSKTWQDHHRPCQKSTGSQMHRTAQLCFGLARSRQTPSTCWWKETKSWKVWMTSNPSCRT